MALPIIKSIDDYNARNPCCCPLPDCPAATVDFEVRAAEVCRKGYSPNLKNYPLVSGDSIVNPNAFDPRTTGVLVPLYKNKKTTNKDVITGRRVIKFKYYGTTDGDNVLVVKSSFSATSVMRYIVSTTLESAYGQTPESWPASGNLPLGQCPPEDTILPADSPGGLTASVIASGGAGDTSSETTTTFKLSWTDNRPEVTYPTGGGESGTDPLTEKAGSYQVRVDGGSVPLLDATSAVILLNNTDNTEHQFSVRHVCGEGTGQWSAPKKFNLVAPGCAPTVYLCNVGETTGNPQRSVPYSVSDAATTFTTSQGSGVSSSCKAISITPDPVYGTPPWEGGVEASITAYNKEVTADKTVETYTGTYNATPDTEHPENPGEAETTDPPPTPPEPPPEVDPETPLPGWENTLNSNIAAKTGIVTVTYSNDQNGGDVTLAALYTEALAIHTGFGDVFGWGLGANYNGGGVASRPNFSRSVRCLGDYQITNGDGLQGGGPYVTLAQARYRWYVPKSHTGASHTTHWQIGRFDDRWVKWAQDFYTWAVGKYDFLNRPKPGDDDYPVIEDYEDAAGLADAIAGLPQDPGIAPNEVESLRPLVVETPIPWLWSNTQAESEPETISICDPTRNGRVLKEPVDPGGVGHDAWVIAHAAWVAAVAAALAKSKRVSPWYRITPTRVSDVLLKPDPVPPLPTDPPPTAGAVAARARQVTTYNFLLARYDNPARRHESFRLCNVRRFCGATPAGTILSYDTGFPTTELPPLDPTKANPRVWANWYDFT